MVGVREAVRPRLRGRDDRALAEEERRLLRAEEREQLRDRLVALRVGERVAAALRDAERESVPLGQAGEQLGAVRVVRPQLEVGVSGPGHGAGGQERPAQVRGAAARAADEPRGRALQRREPGADDPGLVQHLERARVVVQVDLEARLVLEGPAAVRADLALDVVLVEERHGPPRDRVAPQLQVQPDPAAAAQVDRPGAAHERGQLGEPATGLARIDRRELAANILGEAHGAPSTSRRRRLYSTPSEP